MGKEHAQETRKASKPAAPPKQTAHNPRNQKSRAVKTTNRIVVKPKIPVYAFTVSSTSHPYIPQSNFVSLQTLLVWSTLYSFQHALKILTPELPGSRRMLICNLLKKESSQLAIVLANWE